MFLHCLQLTSVAVVLVTDQIPHHLDLSIMSKDKKDNVRGLAYERLYLYSLKATGNESYFTFVVGNVQGSSAVIALHALFASSTGANRLMSASKQTGLFRFSAIVLGI